MDERKIEAGDVVKLKSGGPPMTVTAVNGETILVCWFPELTHATLSGAFPRIALERVEPIREET